MYWKYLKYLLGHKWNVGIECLKMGMFIHAFTHDLSKFLPSEFGPYARNFFGKQKGDHAQLKAIFDFEKAWLSHQRRNKHHWDYWVQPAGPIVPMPTKHVKQMVVDWRGMSRKLGDTAENYYQGEKGEMIMHYATTKRVEICLGIRPKTEL